jgi:hypothetical protein
VPAHEIRRAALLAADVAVVAAPHLAYDRAPAMESGARTPARPSRFAPGVLLAAAAMLAATPSWAQTEADKATARTLAQQGVKLKNEGHHAEALERLQRAQQIFDAPTHLLLIAQCQVAIGKWVEGAETYRLLSRAAVGPRSPEAFRKAKEQGTQELAALEQRIPAVRIGVEPENVASLALAIDGEPVPAAVVGVDRVINPGDHEVVASAPGYARTAVKVRVSPGQRVPVRLRLERAASTSAGVPLPAPAPAPAAVPPVAPPPPADGRGPPSTQPARGARDSQQRPSRDVAPPLSIVLSVRALALYPWGSAGNAVIAQQSIEGGSVRDNYGPGGGFEVHGTLRFSRHFGAFLFGGAESLSNVDNAAFYRRQLAIPGSSPDPRVAQTSGIAGGVGLQFVTCRDCVALLAEASFLGRKLSQQLDSPCAAEISRSGGMFKMLVGLELPVSRAMRITPFGAAAVGELTSMQIDLRDSACALGPKAGSGSLAGSKGLYALSGGVGGSYAWDLGGP